MSMDAEELGLQNLRRVLKALGGRWEANAATATLEINGDTYRISPGHIMRFSENHRQGGTCFHMGGASMPFSEQIASAALLLHHDPSIFDRWHSQNGLYV